MGNTKFGAGTMEYIQHGFGHRQRSLNLYNIFSFLVFMDITERTLLFLGVRKALGGEFW